MKGHFVLVYVTEARGYHMPGVMPITALKRDPAALRVLYGELRWVIEAEDRPKQVGLWPAEKVKGQ